MTSDERKFFHYTTGQKIGSIRSDGLIRPGTAFVQKPERPAVWFSREPFWEPTAAKMLGTPQGPRRLAMREHTQEICGGLFRIVVDAGAAPHDWSEFRTLSGVLPALARGLAKVAKMCGANPRNWRVSFEPVPLSSAIAIESFDGHRWVDAGVLP